MGLPWPIKIAGCFSAIAGVSPVDQQTRNCAALPLQPDNIVEQ
jgi:hypothetical protein